jgi:taurine dioxygenase
LEQQHVASHRNTGEASKSRRTEPALLNVVPTKNALGAEIRDIDLSAPISDGTIAAIRSTWLEHLVLLFRHQQLDDASLVAFSSRFGELEVAPLYQGGRYVEDFPEVMIISNVIEGGRSIGSLGNSEAEWHIDLNFTDTPPDAGFLHAHEVPSGAGRTGFANLYAAFETLSPALKERVQGLRLKHDARFNSAGESRAERLPDAVHPLVRTHPDTGRKALFLGRRSNSAIVDMDPEESEVLLDLLWAHATAERYCWHQDWIVGDLVMWDNRCTLHRRDALDPHQRRVMHRTQIKGTRPY